MQTSLHINIHCTISHDAILQDYAALAPGVHVSGHVHLGKIVYVGTGAVFINGSGEKPIMIGDDPVIMTGYITGEPLNQVYSHARLFVLPSYHEGLPIVFLKR